MDYRRVHSISGRIRVHIKGKKRLSIDEAEYLEAKLRGVSFIRSVKIYERLADASVEYDGDEEEVLRSLRETDLSLSEKEKPLTGRRSLNVKTGEKLILHTIRHFTKRLFLPYPARCLFACLNSGGYISKGIRTLVKSGLKVEVLDAAAVSVSLLRKDPATAASVMFLLKIGEILEEWTHKKSVYDLADAMDIRVDTVKVKSPSGEEKETDASLVKPGDRVLVYMGTMIPFDGTVKGGEAMVNQSGLTGESAPVRKTEGDTVYAGTVLEEGNLEIEVKETAGNSRFESIVALIETGEKMKSAAAGKAERIADRLVPYSFAGVILTWLITRNVNKALSILMVDFSCALKLAMPVTVISAMRDCLKRGISVKGGKFLEAVAKADTIVFDKTGTLTKATPEVVRVIPFNGNNETEMLRTAACLEEHFPHSVANAVVRKAEEQNLRHREIHSDVRYIVAHGIASEINGKRAVIGSGHFIFEDESCIVPENEKEKFEAIPPEYSHLYLAIDGVLSAVICISDPVKETAGETIRRLKGAGFENVIMMTGDSERTAHAIATQTGIDEYYAEVLPEEKSSLILKKQKEGHTVVMVGDGVNDSPALSAANAGIAIAEGAHIAAEVADITIHTDDLLSLVLLKKLAIEMDRRVEKNYRSIIGFNSGLIILGLFGFAKPSRLALLHNASTLAIGLKSMTPLELK